MLYLVVDGLKKDVLQVSDGRQNKCLKVIHFLQVHNNLYLIIIIIFPNIGDSLYKTVSIDSKLSVCALTLIDAELKIRQHYAFTQTNSLSLNNYCRL